MGSPLMQMPIVINESSEESVVGAVYVFRSLDSAESYIEPWYVGESYWAYDGTGQPLRIIATDERTKIAVDGSRAPNPDRLHDALVNFLKDIPAESANSAILPKLSLSELISRAVAHATA